VRGQLKEASRCWAPYLDLAQENQVYRDALDLVDTAQNNFEEVVRRFALNKIRLWKEGLSGVDNWLDDSNSKLTSWRLIPGGLDDSEPDTFDQAEWCLEDFLNYDTNSEKYKLAKRGAPNGVVFRIKSEVSKDKAR